MYRGWRTYLGSAMRPTEKGGSSYFPSQCLKPSSGLCSPSTLKTPPSPYTLHHLPIQLLKPKDYAVFFPPYIQNGVSGEEKAQGPGPDTTSYYVKHRPVGSKVGETESAKKRPNQTSEAESPNQTSSGQRALIGLRTSGQKCLDRARYPNTFPAHQVGWCHLCPVRAQWAIGYVFGLCQERFGKGR